MRWGVSPYQRDVPIPGSTPMLPPSRGCPGVVTPAMLLLLPVLAACGSDEVAPEPEPQNHIPQFNERSFRQSRLTFSADGTDPTAMR